LSWEGSGKDPIYWINAVTQEKVRFDKVYVVFFSDIDEMES
jgi:hypothetical protein